MASKLKGIVHTVHRLIAQTAKYQHKPMIAKVAFVSKTDSKANKEYGLLGKYLFKMALILLPCIYYLQITSG